VDFIQARNFTPSRGRHIDLLVIHSMENQEKPGAARQVAQWFAGPDAPEASAHFCIDSHEVIQCVRETDVAWAAPGANHNGIHLEHAGMARQTAEDWADVYSASMLDVSIRLATSLCKAFGIPPELVGVAGLKVGRRGITTHAYVTQAFKLSTHTDPGLEFPLLDYCRRVAELLAKETV
jgi:N-acetyl-anhydromuramyl-L-alanine amidase AmpD